MDYWDAIAKYNLKQFEEEKIISKQKDYELKKRLKEDLDKQMKDKLIVKSEQVINDREFDKVVIQHVQNLRKIEIQREIEKKEKMVKEKESRDQQLKDQKIKKKKQTAIEKKIEKEQGI
jgi:hypothetical protein